MMRIWCLATAFSAVAMAAAAAELRQVELDDFASPEGQLNLGGEYPGAKADLTFPDGKCARIEMDTTAGGQYVGYSPRLTVPAGTESLTARVRCDRSVQVALRALDSAGTWHYAAKGLGKVGEWADVTFRFAEVTDHWGGKNTAEFVFPLKQVIVSGVAVNAKCVFEIGSIAVGTTASEEELPTCDFRLKPVKKGAVWYPQDEPSFAFAFRRLRTANSAGVKVTLRDWLGNVICRKDVPSGETEMRFEASRFRGRFGGFEAFAETRVGGVVRSSSCWFARLTGPDPKPCKWVGSNIWWLWESAVPHPGSELPFDQVYLDQLTAAGIGRVRYERVWSGYEPKPGVYDDSPAFTAFVDEICRRGIEHHCILAYENGKSYPDNPFDPDAYARCIAHMASLYKGRINTFEIWNEPQNTGFLRQYCFGGDWDAWKKAMGASNFCDYLWGHHADEWIKPFAVLTQKAAAAARQANPQVDVSVAVMDIAPTLDRMLTNDIAGAEDIVSFHPYCHERLRPEEEWFFNDGGEHLRTVMARNGGAKRLMISEAGWTTVSTNDPSSWFVGNYPKSTYEQQARYTIRMYLLARQFGVENSMQHNFANNGPDRNYTEHNFGLVHEDFTPKPAYAAIAYLTRLLGDAEPKGDLSSDSKKYRLYRFEKSGRTVLAAWSVNGNLDVSLPAAVTSVGGVRDIMGNDAKAATLECRTLHLTENPVYIRCE